MLIDDSILDAVSCCICIKDKDSKYLYCNEFMAEFAGVDSPSEILGKTDRQLIWRKHADLYRYGEVQVLNGKSYENIVEPMSFPDRDEIAILVTKALYKKNPEGIDGVIVKFFQIGEKLLKEKNGYFLPNHKYFFRCNDQDKTLALQQIRVLKYLFLGKTVKSIAAIMNISPRTVEDYIEVIKDKIECKNKEELILRAWALGLSHIALLEF
jgi:DNA-binding CsgD family transcriptional regulator